MLFGMWRVLFANEQSIKLIVSKQHSLSASPLSQLTFKNVVPLAEEVNDFLFHVIDQDKSRTA
jgi:hypothetical protein